MEDLLYKNYRITEVANWLSDDSIVKLPVIQRGFVWKPSQIETLWDSLFRGFPIGSFLLSRTGDSLYLLDGQQRCTSIALGFYNPWAMNEQDHKTIGNLKNLPVIWIDTAPLSMSSTQKYVFRVVTRSHPWGYQCTNNNNMLSVSYRKEASRLYKDLFNQGTYTNLRATERFPYDSNIPIPLSFLLESATKENSKHDLLTLCRHWIPEELKTRGLQQSEENYYIQLEKQLETKEMDCLMDTAKSILEKMCFPTIQLSDKILLEEDSSEDPTLFVRLNSQGTKVSNEDLMYSLFKSIYPKSKELVDTIGLSFIPPSRVILLTARLVLSENKYVASISLPQFRNLIKNKDNVFRLKLEHVIGSFEDSPIKKIIDRAIEILEYNNVPHIVIKKFIRESPNGFLLLLHWLYDNFDNEEWNINLNDELKRKICARLFRNHWFGNMDYMVSQKWLHVKDPNFWDKDVENIGWIYEYPFVAPSTLESFLINRLQDAIENHNIGLEDDTIWKIWESRILKNDDIEDIEWHQRIKNGWIDFLWRLLNVRDKSLILLAQRDYINKTFAEYNQLEDLEDSNTPWDWDHIYPQSWVYHQRNIDDRTRLWEWRIGNFRAMSLTDNRSENNNLSPAERFNSVNNDYFIKDNDLEFWKKLDQDHRFIKATDNEYVLIHAKAIIKRSVNIYQNFLEMFGINYS